jgi:hypothetical protein
MANTTMLTRRRVILAALESTYGTDATPTGSANAILVKSLNVTPMSANIVGRDLIRPYFGNFSQLVADAHVQLDFEVELAGSGTAGTAPAYDALLQSCGFGAPTIVAATSVNYKPISANVKSATIYFYNDGALHKITGAYGDAEVMITARQIPSIKFTFTGIYNAPTATALPTTVFTAFQTPLVANTTNTPSFSLFGYSALLEKYTFKLGNQVDFRALVGKQYVALLDRKVSGSVEIQAMTVDVKDYFAPALSGATGDMVITHGTTAGNIVTIDSPYTNIQNPSYADNNGVQMLNIPFVSLPSAGNDELSITLT